MWRAEWAVSFPFYNVADFLSLLYNPYICIINISQARVRLSTLKVGQSRVDNSLKRSLTVTPRSPYGLMITNIFRLCSVGGRCSTFKYPAYLPVRWHFD